MTDTVLQHPFPTYLAKVISRYNISSSCALLRRKLNCLQFTKWAMVFRNCFCSFYSCIELELIYKGLYIFNLYNLVNFDICKPSLYHHHNEGNSYVHHLPEFPCAPLFLCFVCTYGFFGFCVCVC